MDGQVHKQRGGSVTSSHICSNTALIAAINAIFKKLFNQKIYYKNVCMRLGNCAIRGKNVQCRGIDTGSSDLNPPLPRPETKLDTASPSYMTVTATFVLNTKFPQSSHGNQHFVLSANQTQRSIFLKVETEHSLSPDQK